MIDMDPTPTTHVSDFYELGRGQEALDFVDVNVVGDTPVYIDPTAIRLLRTDWTDRCVSLLQDFFSELLNTIRAGQVSRGEHLLQGLREPNETKLGLSQGRPRGSATARRSATTFMSPFAGAPA